MTWWRLLLMLLLGALGFAPGAFSQQVAITIDDLPSHGILPPGMTRVDVTKSLLQALEDAHAPKVYGFVNARKLEQHPEDVEVLKLWRAAGFPLGNHTFAHLGIGSATAEQFDQNISLDEPLLQSLMGRHDWHWFRYPYLSEGDTLEKRHTVRVYLHDHKYHIAQVTLDFEDYMWNAPYARCVEKNDAPAIAWLKASYMLTAAEYIGAGQAASQLLFGRDIRHVLLLHIGGFETVMLPQLLDYLRRNHFKFVTLPEAEKDPAYRSDPDVPMRDGGTLLDQLLDARHLQLPPYAAKPQDQLNSLCR